MERCRRPWRVAYRAPSPPQALFPPSVQLLLRMARIEILQAPCLQVIPKTSIPEFEPRNTGPEASKSCSHPACRFPETSNPFRAMSENLHPEHSTLNTQHSTLNTQHSTLNTQHSALSTQPSTLNTKPQTLPGGRMAAPGRGARRDFSSSSLLSLQVLEGP